MMLLQMAARKSEASIVLSIVACAQPLFAYSAEDPNMSIFSAADDKEVK